MGVLNLTPDSFYAGARVGPGEALERVDALVREGPELLDLGAESSRPGSAPVSASDQIERLAPALERALGHAEVWVSVDTSSPRVARYALKKGAHAINDVSCLRDEDLARAVADFGATLILMHARAPMSQMKGFSDYPEDGYGDVIADVSAEWAHARDRACARGLGVDRVWFDPGLGFNKSASHSFEILRRLSEFRSLGAPIVVGPSRKSFIAAVDNAPPEGRLGGTLAACVLAVQRGADVLRVHDVQATHQALGVQRAIEHGMSPHA